MGRKVQDQVFFFFLSYEFRNESFPDTLRFDNGLGSDHHMYVFTIKNLQRKIFFHGSIRKRIFAKVLIRGDDRIVRNFCSCYAKKRILSIWYEIVLVSSFYVVSIPALYFIMHKKILLKTHKCPEEKCAGLK